MEKILAVCWDAGPAKNIGLVVKMLRQMDHNVVLYAGGPSVAVLNGLSVEYLFYISAEETVRSCHDAKAFYSAVDCNDRMPGEEIAHLLMEQGNKMPILLQSDFWGAGLYRNDSWRDIVPTRFFGHDKRDVSLSRQAFPLLDPDDALIYGWPWVDAYSDFSEIPVREKNLRQMLSIPEKMPVVFFAGQLNRTGEVWESLVNAIIALDRPVYLLSRIHPRMLAQNDPDQEWKKEFDRYQSGVDRYLAWGKGKYKMCPDPIEVKDLIAVSGVTVGAFTTVLLEATAWRKPTISILYPQVGMAEWRRVTHDYMLEFPLTEQGCSAKATTDRELERLLGEAYSGTLEEKLRANQDKHFRSDGKNTYRVAEEIVSFL